MKRLAVTAIILAVAVFFSGCSFTTLDSTDIMCPPKATGAKSDIQELIDKETSGEYTLKYPKSGSSRSSIALCDVDSDEEDESVAFYTTQDKKLHMLFVQCNDEEYSVADDIICDGSDIDLLEFADIDGDKIKEVIIGYSTAATSQSLLTIYRFTDKVSRLDAMCSYSSLVVGDFNYDSKSDILLLSLFSGDTPAMAKLMVYNENNGLSESGSVTLDSEITQFASLKFGKITEDINGAVIDGINAAGDYSTQLIFFDPSQPALMNPLYLYYGYSMTKRSVQISSTDINKDNIIDIPICAQMSYDSSDDADSVCKLVNWSQYSSSAMSLNTVKSDILCLSDGYMLDVPSKWLDAVTARYDAKKRQTTVYVWGYSNGSITKCDPLITIKAFTKDEFTSDSEGFVEIQTSGNTVFAYILNSTEHYLAIAGDDINDMFSLVTNI